MAEDDDEPPPLLAPDGTLQVTAASKTPQPAATVAPAPAPTPPAPTPTTTPPPPAATDPRFPRDFEVPDLAPAENVLGALAFMHRQLSGNKGISRPAPAKLEPALRATEEALRVVLDAVYVAPLKIEAGDSAWCAELAARARTLLSPEVVEEPNQRLSAALAEEAAVKKQLDEARRELATHAERLAQLRAERDRASGSLAQMRAKVEQHVRSEADLSKERAEKAATVRDPSELRKQKAAREAELSAAKAELKRATDDAALVHRKLAAVQKRQTEWEQQVEAKRRDAAAKAEAAEAARRAVREQEAIIAQLAQDSEAAELELRTVVSGSAAAAAPAPDAAPRTRRGAPPAPVLGECAVCLSPAKVVLAPCGHGVCRNCVNTLRFVECPQCNVPCTEYVWYD